MQCLLCEPEASQMQLPPPWNTSTHVCFKGRCEDEVERPVPACVVLCFILDSSRVPSIFHSPL